MDSGEQKRTLFPEVVLSILTLGVVLVGLYLSSRLNYLLFHNLAEIFSIVVAWGVFVLAWNSRHNLDNHYLLFAGIAYLFVGSIDIFHTLAYKGMKIFEDTTPNLAAQLWIAGRYLESGSLLLAPLFIYRKINARLVMLIYAAITCMLLGAVLYWRVFPNCYVEGVGLTPFKITSEYVICGILATAFAVLIFYRREFDQSVLWLLGGSIIATIASEIAFTTYGTAYDPQNLTGHLLKIVSFYLIYKALIQTGLVKPYALLFRNLKQSEEKYRQLVELAQEGIWAIDDEANTTFVNPRMAEMLGYQIDEMIGRPLFAFMDEHGRKIAQENVERRKAGIREQHDFEFLKKDGTRLYASLETSPLTDDNGEYAGALACVADITERKRAENALRAAHDFQKQILSTAATAIFLVDARQRITNVNDAFCAITGFSREDVIGQRCEILRGDRCTHDCRLLDPKRSEPVLEKECTIRAKDGRGLTIIKNADPVRENSGRIVGGIESFVDVSSLVEAREAAEAANRAKSAFLANMSHELRTPLTAILGFAEALSHEACGPMNEEQQRSVGDIHESGKHLLSLISDLLDLAKVEVGKTNMNLEPVDLDTEIEWSLLLVKERAERSRIELTADLPDGMPPVRADRRALRQVLLNLLTNAIKFTPDGGRVEVCTSVNQHNVIVEIIDTGIGIAPDEMERIFDTFERSNRTESRSVEGVGLGLPLVRGLLRAMGGTITVQSAIDEGSRFTITVPIESSATPPERKTDLGRGI